MVHRSFIIKQLQRPQRALRRRQPRRLSIEGKIAVVHKSEALPSLPTFGESIPKHGKVKGCASFGVTHVDVSAGSTSDITTPIGSQLNPLDGEARELDVVLVDVMREIAVLKKLDHPNIVRLHE
eukprot:gene20277-27037_t